MATSQDFVTWTCGPMLNPRFLLYALRGLRDEILGMRMGSTHQTIYMPDIERIAIPAPSLQQQAKMVRLLDAETARIDALVAKKRHLLRLTRARLEAVVENALAPYSRTVLKRRCNLLPGYAFESSEFTPDGSGPRLLRGINVAAGSIRWTGAVRLSTTPRSKYDRYRLEAGDVVIGMDRPFIADGTRVALVGERDAGSYIVQRVCRIRAEDPAAAELVRWALASRAFAAYVAPALTGVSVPHLSDEQIGNFAIPEIDGNELRALIVYLRRCDRYNDELTAAIGRQIALLQEHRQALITAAVTGEMDVLGVPQR